MRAAAERHEKTVQALIDKGADVNARDSKGKTALMLTDAEEDTILQILINAMQCSAR